MIVDAIRSRLNRDRAWSAYAIGDLAPEASPHCDWRIDDGGLALIYREFDPPILLTTGDISGLSPGLNDPRYGLHIRPEAIAALEPRFALTLTSMRRMTLDPARFTPCAGETAAVTMADLASIETLYADGDDSADRPDFFFPSMLSGGAFRAVWEDGEIIAAAGTHIINESERVAAIGNVYTRRDRRGRGLARRATSAVVEDLLRRGIETIVLNVRESNTPAARVYASLGFHDHCGFCEGLAVRR